ncbi:hypothetical protein L3Y34_017593 [Caenorhabditis briggsae]|uniref:Uncharacterized protein n=1 Tax=Caenorhabditis briggsae TaxID=6238 RepID=A0AAE9DI68_CAEBR|nr:hypothetical protein L3Y34_017593 [Caenorhabditis briggsae]
MNPVIEVVEETVTSTPEEKKKAKKSVKEVKRRKTKKDENQNDIPDTRPKFLCIPLGRPSLLRKGRKASYTFSTEDLRTQEPEAAKKSSIFTYLFDSNALSKNEKQRQRRLSNILADNELFASDDVPVCHRSSNRI